MTNSFCIEARGKKMNITLTRKHFSEKSTVGDLFINDKWFCYTLEDVDRQRQGFETILPWSSSLKIPRETAIPRGEYEIIVNVSNRFKKSMPLLLNVPDFLGVRIHSGNTAEHTEGCILVGKFKNPDMITGSRDAFKDLFKVIESTLKKEKIFILIK
jgi:hypothetical protein